MHPFPGKVLALGQAQQAGNLAVEQGDEDGLALLSGRCQR
jgi:hypothetical protein